MASVLYPPAGFVPSIRTGDILDIVVHNTSAISAFNYDCSYSDTSTEGVAALQCQGSAKTSTSNGIVCGGYGDNITACGCPLTVPPCTANLGPWLCFYSVNMESGQTLDTQYYNVINISDRATTTSWGSLPTYLAVVSTSATSTSSSTRTTSTASSTSGISAASSSAAALAAAEAAAASRHRAAVIGGAVGGSIGGVLLLLLLLFCCWWCRRRSKSNDNAGGGGMIMTQRQHGDSDERGGILGAAAGTGGATGGRNSTEIGGNGAGGYGQGYNGYGSNEPTGYHTPQQPLDMTQRSGGGMGGALTAGALGAAGGAAAGALVSGHGHGGGDGSGTNTSGTDGHGGFVSHASSTGGPGAGGYDAKGNSGVTGARGGQSGPTFDDGSHPGVDGGVVGGRGPGGDQQPRNSLSNVPFTTGPRDLSNIPPTAGPQGLSNVPPTAGPQGLSNVPSTASPQGQGPALDYHQFPPAPAGAYGNTTSGDTSNQEHGFSGFADEALAAGAGALVGTGIGAAATRRSMDGSRRSNVPGRSSSRGGYSSQGPIQGPTGSVSRGYGRESGSFDQPRTSGVYNYPDISTSGSHHYPTVYENQPTNTAGRRSVDYDPSGTSGTAQPGQFSSQNRGTYGPGPRGPIPGFSGEDAGIPGRPDAGQQHGTNVPGGLTALPQRNPDGSYPNMPPDSRYSGSFYEPSGADEQNTVTQHPVVRAGPVVPLGMGGSPYSAGPRQDFDGPERRTSTRAVPIPAPVDGKRTSMIEDPTMIGRRADGTRNAPVAVPRGPSLFRDRQWSQSMDLTEDQIYNFINEFLTAVDLERYATESNVIRMRNEMIPMMRGTRPSIMLSDSHTPTSTGYVSTKDLNPIILDIPGAQHFAHYTVFDLLGWCIARSAEPVQSDITDETYISLLTVYSKWCSIVGKGSAAPQSVSVVSYGGSYVLSASLPGGPASRAVQEARGTHLEQLHISGFPPSVPFSNLVKYSLGERARPVLHEYGHCAESHAFMALCMSDESTRISMHALTMKARDQWAHVTVGSRHGYDQSSVIPYLAPPCSNCTKLFAQVFGSFGFIRSHLAISALQGRGAELGAITEAEVDVPGKRDTGRGRYIVGGSSRVSGAGSATGRNVFSDDPSARSSRATSLIRSPQAMDEPHDDEGFGIFDDVQNESYDDDVDFDGTGRLAGDSTPARGGLDLIAEDDDAAAAGARSTALRGRGDARSAQVARQVGQATEYTAGQRASGFDEQSQLITGTTSGTDVESTPRQTGQLHLHTGSPTTAQARAQALTQQAMTQTGSTAISRSHSRDSAFSGAGGYGTPRGGVVTRGRRTSRARQGSTRREMSADELVLMRMQEDMNSAALASGGSANVSGTGYGTSDLNTDGGIMSTAAIISPQSTGGAREAFSSTSTTTKRMSTGGFGGGIGSGFNTGASASASGMVEGGQEVEQDEEGNLWITIGGMRRRYRSIEELRRAARLVEEDEEKQRAAKQASGSLGFGIFDA